MRKAYPYSEWDLQGTAAQLRLAMQLCPKSNHGLLRLKPVTLKACRRRPQHVWNQPITFQLLTCIEIVRRTPPEAAHHLHATMMIGYLERYRKVLCSTESAFMLWRKMERL
jgi:hypothetical protein